ncbi:MAG: hypothetical protein DLD55_02945 [candidate division SR1 bacterium]|nr:MAG: hypothetical protein DLD55_02945 [candidate division SR1 bacterium]
MAKTNFLKAKKFLEEAGFKECIDKEELELLEQVLSGSLPENWDNALPQFHEGTSVLAELEDLEKKLFAHLLVFKSEEESSEIFQDVFFGHLESRLGPQILDMEIVQGGKMILSKNPTFVVVLALVQGIIIKVGLLYGGQIFLFL